MKKNKLWVKGTGLVIYDVDKAPPTVPISSQVLGEVKFMHVTFNLSLSRSPRSSSTSLALHYDAFDPSYRGVMCLSLHMPNHLNLFSRIFAERGATPNFSLNSLFLILSMIVLPHIHLRIRISFTSILYSKTFFTGQHFVPYNNPGLIATW